MIPSLLLISATLSPTGTVASSAPDVYSECARLGANVNWWPSQSASLREWYRYEVSIRENVSPEALWSFVQLEQSAAVGLRARQADAFWLRAAVTRFLHATEAAAVQDKFKRERELAKVVQREVASRAETPLEGVVLAVNKAIGVRREDELSRAAEGEVADRFRELDALRSGLSLLTPRVDTLLATVFSVVGDSESGWRVEPLPAGFPGAGKLKESGESFQSRLAKKPHALIVSPSRTLASVFDRLQSTDDCNEVDAAACLERLAKSLLMPASLRATVRAQYAEVCACQDCDPFLRHPEELGDAKCPGTSVPGPIEGDELAGFAGYCKPVCPQLRLSDALERLHARMKEGMEQAAVPEWPNEVREWIDSAEDR